MQNDMIITSACNYCEPSWVFDKSRYKYVFCAQPKFVKFVKFVV